MHGSLLQNGNVHRAHSFAGAPVHHKQASTVASPPSCGTDHIFCNNTASLGTLGRPVDFAFLRVMPSVGCRVRKSLKLCTGVMAGTFQITLC